MTNSRTDSQSSLPRPTSIEAILQTPSSAATDDLAADPRLRYIGDWTRVTADIGFLAHLFTIWTEREYVYYHFLDREAFLADLSCSRDDFCSELLVNAVLVSACVSLFLQASPSQTPSTADCFIVPLILRQRSQQAVFRNLHPDSILSRSKTIVGSRSR